MGTYRLKHLETSVEKTQRTYIKLSLGALIGIIFLIALFWAGHDVYVRWQERRLIRQAVTAFEAHDIRNASLAARTVLQMKPTSAAAARMMAQVAERVGDRAALEWRRKVVQVDPQSIEDVLAWARCALQFNDIGTAERALAQIDTSGKQTAGYHAVAGLLAQAQRQNEKAEAEWSEAVRLAPNEKAYQLQLGITRLRARDIARRDEGVAMLQSLRQDPVQRAPATRALITEGIARRDKPQVLLDLARELQSYPEAILNDRILFLDLLHQLQDPKFSSYLSELEKSTSTSPFQLSTLLSWMSQHNLNLVALDFIKNLPREIMEKWPVPPAVADVYVRLKDWRKLEEATKNANWRDFEFLRHAYVARALREQDKPAASQHEWSAAIKGASVDSDWALMLLRAVSEWRWETEAVELLWAVAKQPEKQNEAFLTLYRHYAKSGDTQGLYKVLVRLFEADPANLNVENNLAQISLLLNANPDEARRLAADVYQKMPGNPAYATTYAYALITKGDTKGALKVMSGLTEEQLADPAVSAYYGICLAAAKDPRARSFLDSAQAATLLPEEKALLVKAESSLN
jgi:thioredoxin-like negative regulator of GroEL